MSTQTYTFETKDGFQIFVDLKELMDEHGEVFGYDVEVFRDGIVFLYRQCCSLENALAVLDDLPFEQK